MRGVKPESYAEQLGVQATGAGPNVPGVAVTSVFRDRPKCQSEIRRRGGMGQEISWLFFCQRSDFLDPLHEEIFDLRSSGPLGVRLWRTIYIIDGSPPWASSALQQVIRMESSK